MGESIKVTKREAAEMITKDMVKTLMDNQNEDEVTDVLMYGCEGWYNQASSELETELRQRFDKKYEVI